jgi:hypothetical protein
MGEIITDVDIEEISSCGPPAYQRAVVKSMGFSEQISKQMGEKRKMEKNNEGIPASAPAQAQVANDAPAPVSAPAESDASAIAPKSDLTNADPAPIPAAPVSDKKDAENVAEKPADQNTQSSDKTGEKNEVVEKAVQSGISNFVKSKDFDIIVEKSVEKILSKKSVSEPNDKFQASGEDLSKKDIGELGASFLKN